MNRSESRLFTATLEGWITGLCAVLLALSAHTAHAGINVWTSHGPEGGYIRALAINRSTPSTLYAGTAGGGVFDIEQTGPVPTGTSSWVNTSPMITARAYQTATLLPNGKVLVAGGQTNDSNRVLSSLSSAELYDPATGTWTATGALNTGRWWHTATLLPNGKVLVAGGQTNDSSGVLSSAELYDPATGTWTMTGQLNNKRSLHTMTVLPNGKVLVSGGVTNLGSFLNGNYISSAELYDPATGRWTPTGAMMSARGSHTATLLPNGKVFVVGGSNDTGTAALPSTELYDPAAGTWTPSGGLTIARRLHTATLLSNGKVLTTGGDNNDTLFSAELYDPATGTWTATGALNTGRWWHTATLLPNGMVLVSGGGSNSVSISSVELYNPTTGTWTAIGTLNTARWGHTATLLANGEVLIAGGNNGNIGNTGGGFPLSSAELYEPAAGTVTPTATPPLTGTLTPRPSATLTASATVTATLSRTPTPTVAPSHAPMPTPLLVCSGDCGGDGAVTVDEIITLVNIDLGTADASACPNGISSGSGVDIALIIQAANNALNGCPGEQIINVAGTWSWNETQIEIISGSCSAIGDVENYTLTITQDGDQLGFISNDVGVSSSITGSIKGHSISATGTVQVRDGCSVQDALSLTVSADGSTLAGKLSQASGDADCCTGTFEISATKWAST